MLCSLSIPFFNRLIIKSILNMLCPLARTDVDNHTDKGLMLPLHHICRHAQDANTANRRPKKLMVMYQMMNQKTYMYHIWQKNKSAMI